MLTSEKPLKRKKLRYAEYYDMTEITDRLYRESKEGKVFCNLMELITSQENIKLAYRSIKRNSGSVTPGTDKQTINDIERMSEEEFVCNVQRKLAWYKPKPVRRKEIPKPNGKMRPLGIPTIMDRIIQQCILQILEPICEAKFHNRSNGFRTNRSAENAIAQCCQMINLQKLYFVVDVDIKGFFDNVDHCKLKQQMWNMGIRDKKLLCIISEILRAPIVMSDGSIEYPAKGTPQGGVLSPILANIVLNELDWWIASQWENLPTKLQYKEQISKNGSPNKGNKYRALKKTFLKEMYLVRYADDFKIFCRKRSDANKVFLAVEKWLEDRLKLSISEEKSKVINLKRSYSEFLGFKLKAVPKGGKLVVKSHMVNKAIKKEATKLITQIKAIQKPKNQNEEYLMINQYNSMVMGIQNYYHYATRINHDCKLIAWQVNTVLKNRLNFRLKKAGKLEEGYIKDRYGVSKQLRFCGGKPIVPIGYVQWKNPMQLKRSVCNYTPKGRAEIHKSLGINISVLHALMRATMVGRSIEFMDNRISLYAAQNGKCAVTGKQLEFEEIHCHHKLPLSIGGSDKYQNLIIIHRDTHKLVHATERETISRYINQLNINNTMLIKLNKLRKMMKFEQIVS
jgi:group II intron reverse transcriptase/maturase